MLSRVADNLYWFGRYTQRAENTARMVGVHAHLMLDLPRSVSFGWAPLVQILGADAPFRDRYGDDYCEENVVRFLIADPEHPGSVAFSLREAREILRTVRDCMPSDAWEKINDIHLFLQEHGEKSLVRSRRFELLSRLVDSAMLLDGLLLANLNHDVGFRFMQLGTHLEQADMTTRIIEVRSAGLSGTTRGTELAPFQNIQWLSVLRSLMADQMYRRHERTRVSGAAVLRFVMQNREFPRSVSFCLNSIASTLPLLPSGRAAERTLERTRALVRDAHLELLLDQGLRAFLDEIQLGMRQLHDAISDAYFRQ